MATCVYSSDKTCACRCGYTCGGPGRCELDVFECIEKHFVKDCEHDWTGPWKEFKDPSGAVEGGVTCAKCGMYSGSHDMAVGP